MKSLMLLTRWLLDELGSQVGICTARDSETIESRFEKEGLSFLTITLPSFGTGFEQALAEGRVSPSHFPSFRTRGGLPVFLQGFLERVFERGTGQSLAHPDVECVLAIRQICKLHSKIELPTTAARQRKALQNYVQTDQDLGALEFGPRGSRDVDSVAAVLFGPILESFEKFHFSGDFQHFMPKHGPGATADRLVGNQKFQVSEWPRRLEEVFPAGEFLLPNYRDTAFFESVRILEPGEELPVRVTLVPKTMKTPRVIAMEPTAMQFAQQAILRYLVSEILGDKVLSGLIGLDDQVPNQDLARRGSQLGDLATLDLSEASDRVSLQLVERVFARFPGFLEALKATRSTTAALPLEYSQGEVIPLKKFASMGSALCFPVEAMCFLAIIITEMVNTGVLTGTSYGALSKLRGKVRVFGDDIIVPVDFAGNAIEALESYGLKVNRHKSFWTGKFRESCGKDWFDGHDVTIVKVRKPFPRSIRNAEEVVSLVSLRNQLYNAGYWETCRRLDRLIEGVLPHYPIVTDTSAVVGRHSVSFEALAERIHPDYQTPLVRGYVIKVSIPKNEIDGYRALLKYFVSPNREDTEHLKRSGRPSSVRLKKRWSHL